MFNPKTIKLILHVAAMGASSLLLGTIWKAEKEAHQRINEYYKPKTVNEENPED